VVVVEDEERRREEEDEYLIISLNNTSINKQTGRGREKVRGDQNAFRGAPRAA
jgi:hypothetical protein